MQNYTAFSQDDLKATLEELNKSYSEIKAQGLSLNMARGKPCSEQLALSLPMLDCITSSDVLSATDGTDCRNYGVLEGIPEARALMGVLLDEDPDNVIVLGNSSLTIEHDYINMCLQFGTLGSKPWNMLPELKWLCPVPGYDRHFSMLQQYGITMIPVPMDENGPDMDIVEDLVENDEYIKGIWCVPKYSNPTGATYSENTVKRLATMKTAAEDFRIFWDNAYTVHHLNNALDEQECLSDIGKACAESGNSTRYLKFCSTSKITFPGAGISAFGAAGAVLREFKKYLGYQMIGADKLNMLRQVAFLKDAEHIATHMAKHAELLKPRFNLVQEVLSRELGDLGIAEWTNPRGGYFVSFTGLPNTAKRTVALAKEAGVVLTGAGATWPYGKDPEDSNIRIAPTYPSLEELGKALEVFCCCAKIAACEALIEKE